MGEGLCLLNGEGRLFRVPLAKPAGTLGLPFGPLPAPRAKPAEPHPTLGAFFASGSNAPNPLSGERALELNHVFINIWGLRSGFIAGLGSHPSLAVQHAKSLNYKGAAELRRPSRMHVIWG